MHTIKICSEKHYHVNAEGGKKELKIVGHGVEHN